jgi:hypothetical protein
LFKKELEEFFLDSTFIHTRLIDEFDFERLSEVDSFPDQIVESIFNEQLSSHLNAQVGKVCLQMISEWVDLEIVEHFIVDLSFHFLMAVQLHNFTLSQSIKQEWIVD